MSLEPVIHVLLVEDSPTDALLTEEALSLSRFHVQSSERLGDALRLLLDRHFDVVLLDLGLPDSQGLDTLRSLRSEIPQIAVIVLTGKDDERLALQALQEGAQDYLTKNDLQADPLRRAIRYAVERAMSERRLRQSEERLKELTTHIHQVLWMIDAKESKVLYVSPGYQRIWGRSCASLMDNPHSYLDGIHPLDKEMMLRENRRMYRTGHIDVECRVLRPDEVVRWIWVRGYPIWERDDIVRFVGVVEDITEKRSLQEQFQQSQKMEAVGKLASGVAHDFNNMLTIISGYSELLLDSPELDESLCDSVKSIREAGERAAALTRQLLAFSRKSVLELSVIDINESVRETATLLQRLIGEDIVLRTHLDPTIHRVKVDPSKLGQVLMNLAVNARDAMPNGGMLTMETRHVTLDESSGHGHPDVRPGRYVVLAITDNGTGMTPEVLEHIFEPFYTTKGVGRGTGLGLAVVQGIINQSNGHVAVSTELGVGTTFTIYLPAVEASAENGTYTNGHVETGSDRRGTETVLLVEDDERVRRLTTMILQSSGYIVVTAADGAEAIQLADSHGGPFDLLVTDVVMPEMSGPDLAKTLQLQCRAMKVLFTSGYTGDAIFSHEALPNDVAFMQKPYTPSSLAKKVRQLLDDG
jgi:two-component system, cell cycle sensor histidine kinase and response regulator CckA